jgi:amino acid adenylation domain-containing protein
VRRAIPQTGKQDLSDVVQWLLEEAGRVAGISAAAIRIGQPLTAIGFDSLAAVELQHAVTRRYGVQLPIEEVLAGPTLAELAERIAAHRQAPAAAASATPGERAATPIAAAGEQPLSHGQRALWYLARLAPESVAYHIVAAARVRQPLAAAPLERALAALADRHPALRTTFGERGGEPFQTVHVQLAPGFRHFDAGRWSESRLRDHLHQEAWRPFDLAAGPLLRVGLWSRTAGEQVLLLAVHHLVADFLSIETLVRDLSLLYRQEIGERAALPPPPRRSYGDFVRWQAQLLAGPDGERLWEHWRGELAGAPLVLELPLDRPRPVLPTGRGGMERRRVSAGVTDALRAMAGARRATLYSILLTAFQALLARHTGQDDLVVGTPAAGRGSGELAEVVGYFVNAVVLRARLAGDPPFAAVLEQNRRTLAAGLAHQHLPLSLLAERLQPEREPGRPPVFQAMLVWQRARHAAQRNLAAFALGEEGPRVEIGGLSLSAIGIEQRAAQVDLALHAAELDDELALALQYSTDLFEPATVRRLLGHLAALLAGAADDAGCRLSALPLLSPPERAQLLQEWSATGALAPAPSCLHELFLAQVQRSPETVAIEAGCGPEQLTYGELARRAQRLVPALRRLGVGPEARVGVLVGRSPEMVVDLLSVLLAGGCYVPLDPAYPDERLAYMLADSGAAALLTEERWLPRVPAATRVLVVDRRTPERAAAAAPARPSGGSAAAAAGPRNLAYVIYTSGSTGRPKGVAIEHHSAAAFIAWAGQAFSRGELARTLAATSICFDLSVFELFAPLCHGGRAILVPDVLALAERAADRDVTLLNTVPGAAAELLRLGRLPAAVCTVNLAGEAVAASLAEGLHALGTVRRVLNLYGPSEDTVYSTCAEVKAGSARPPAIGRPVAKTRVHLLDRHLVPVPLGAVGEIHLAGEGLARCYLARPELTAERFIPDPFAPSAGARLYRTGDLARHRPDGELVFLGRTDLQVKIRGFRVELGEVEAALAAQPGVAEAVAVVARRDGSLGPQLVAYVAVRGEPGGEALRQALSRRLPAHLVPSTIVVLPALPRTPNGKVDRAALPALDVVGSREGERFRPARTTTEAVICGIWAELLGAERVGIDDGFFALGGHSLLAPRMLARLREACGVELPLRRLFERLTPAALAAEVERLRLAGQGAPAPAASAKSGPVPLSFAQRGLWFLHRLAPASAAYNVPLAVGLEGAVVPAALRAALGEVVRRHQVLRSRFTEVAGEPYQEVDRWAAPALPLVDLAALPSPRREATAAAIAQAAARQVFDLARGPAWRACLLRRGPRQHTLLLVLHHLVSDAWSLDVLLREAAHFYRAACCGAIDPLPEPPLQYADYSHWQLRALCGPAGEEECAYWRGQLAGLVPVSPPADRPRPAVASFRGAVQEGALAADAAAALRQLGRRHGATLYMVLAAGLQSLLFRLTGETDVAIGSPIAGRTHPALQELIGCFVNTLVLRARLAPGMSFADALREVRGVALGAYAHQELPFEVVVDELHPQRDPGSTPLYHVFLAVQAAPLTTLPAAELAWVPRRIANGTAKFDLSLAVWEGSGAALAVEAEHATDLFDAPTVARLLAQWRTLLAAAAAEPAVELGDLPLLSSAESFQVRHEWNDTAPVEHGDDTCLHQLFERQAAQTPDAVAVLSGAVAWTYRALDRRADLLAARLRAAGAAPEVRVGILARREAGMVAGILGVLKAGAAYVPLDPAHPPHRLAALLADSGARLVLADAALSPLLPGDEPRRLLLDAAEPPPRRTSAAARPAHRNLAYVIYTSGSTGDPKGVAIEHRSAVALVRWARAAFADSELAAVLASTSIGFDLSVFELFAPLMRGGTAIVAENLFELTGLPAASQVTLINTVPSALAELLREGPLPAAVQAVNLAGEALPAALVEELLRQPPSRASGSAGSLPGGQGARRVRNLYGPSEDTTYSTCAVFTAAPGPAVPIGRPVGATRAYVLDARLRLLPPGSAGELCLAGAGLARGYLGRPALTAERFRPDPFAGDAGPGAPPGGRLYLTGDLVRQRPDGALEFLGRRDHQVKIHGFRIELDEIAAALCTSPTVRSAVVVAAAAPIVVPPDGAGRGAASIAPRRLVAYVVLEAGQALDAALLRRHLAARLPAPMVPAAFVSLPELPRTASGKVDRGALPAPAAPDLAAAPRRAPRGALEETIAAVWSGVLGLAEVGAEDNFFDCGGHSLLAMRILARIRVSCGVELPLRTLFATPTVAALARAVSAARQPPGLAPPPVTRGAGGGPVPLSFAQQRLWFLDQLEPGSAAYNLPLVIALGGPVDAAALGAALGEIVRRHEVLRTTFPAVRGVPEQQVQAAGPFPLPQIELTTLPAARRRPEALRIAAGEAARPFDLAAGPLLRGRLCRLGGDGELLVLLTHHIVFDGSHEPFLRELARLYGACRRPGPLPPEPPVQYGDFARWQRQWLNRERLAPWLACWRERLAGLPVLELPTDRPRSPAPRRTGKLRPLALGAALTAALAERGRRAGASLYMTLLAAFQALLWRLSDQDDFAVGSPVADRPRPELEDLVGCFTNNLVLRARLTADLGFDDLLVRVRETVLDAHAHRELPFELLVEELQPDRAAGRPPLFQVMLSLLETQLETRQLAPLGAAVSLVQVHGGAARFDLLLALWRGDAGLAGALEHSTELFDAATIERLVGHLLALLQGVAADPERRLAELSLLSAAESHQLRAEWNDSAAPAPERTLHALFELRAAMQPEAPAVVCGGETWSYARLDREANRVAWQLGALGVARGCFVAVYLARSCEMVAGLLGILKAGAAYVPLDVDDPDARLRFILASVGARHAITDGRWLAPLQRLAPPGLRQVICLGAGAAGRLPAGADAPHLTAVSPGDPAYVIFTSGSTGRPKGVLVCHRPVVNLIDWVNRTFAVGRTDRLLFVTSLCFDLSVYDIFGSLAAGATLQVAADEEHRDPERLSRLLATAPITFWDSAPAALQQVVPFAGTPQPGSRSPLRLVFLSGDWIPLALPGQVRELWPQARVVGLGGATEATVWSNFFCVEQLDHAWPSVPYGRPIANAAYRILDRHGNLCPAGVPGDLYIGGACLADGYAAEPALTAARFVPDPWAGLPAAPAPGARLYATGDRARYRAGGLIEFLGRRDQQVKIRGFRIELGEIEATLAEHPAVREAVVLAREDQPGDRRLVAYVVPVEADAPGLSQLRVFLAQRLPEAMVPAAIVVLTALPLTANGKVDRRALPAPRRERRQLAPLAAPRGAVEEELAALWSEALGTDQIGVHDSFFELGGHSLIATRIVAAVRALFGVDLPLRSLFAEPTVAGQARAIAALRRQGSRRAAPPIEPQPRHGHLPLSFAQERLWFMHQLAPASPVYNIHQALRIAGPLDIAALWRSLGRAVQRHEVLRTTFSSSAGRVAQAIAPPRAIAPRVVDLGSLPPAIRERELDRLATASARRPFDLRRGPLLRMLLVALAPERHALLLCLHHAAGDDWSAGLLVRELAAGYRPGRKAPPPPPLPIQYADYAAWQRRWLAAGGLDDQLAYWQERLAGTLPRLALPTDRPRPPVQSFRGAALPLALPPELSAAVRELAQRGNHTLFMVLLAAYACVLGRHAGQEEVVVGTAVANRGQAEVEELIGCFVNILPLRLDLAGNPTYRELLERVHDAALGAYDHQELPFEKLVETLAPQRDLGRAALRQAGFAFQHTSMRPIAFPGGLEVTPLPVDTGVARLDLTLFMWDDGRVLCGTCEYPTDLFAAATVAGWMDDLGRICADMAADLDRPALGAGPAVAPPAPPGERSNLTEGQLLFWFVQQLHPEARLYFDRAAVTFTVPAELDPVHFARAFAALVERCDTLQTSIHDRDGAPMRTVGEAAGAVLELVDLGADPDPPRALACWLDEQGRAPIDLGCRPYLSALLRVSPGHTVWFFAAHHIVIDAWSLTVLARRLSDLYSRSVEGRLAAAPPLPSFEEQVEAERAYRRSPAWAADAEYWRRKLAPPLAAHQFYARSGDPRSGHTDRISVDLGAARSDRIQQLASAQGFYSTLVCFAAALFAYLFRASGEPRQRIGTPFANRSEASAEIVGLVMRACPLAIEADGQESFVAFAGRVQRELIETGRHQRHPVRNPVGNRAYDAYLNFQNVRFADFCGHPVRFELLRSGSAQEALVLQVRDFNGEGKFYLDFDLASTCFPEAAQRERSVGHFLNLLDAFLAAPGQPLAVPSLLALAERQEIAQGPNRTARAYAAGGATLDELVAAQAALTPDRVAVAAGGECLSCHELYARARLLAAFLQQAGAGPDEVVGIAIPRSCELSLGLLGILLAGAAYLPLDLEDPPRRREQILEGAGVALVLTLEDLVERLAAPAARLVCLDRDWARIGAGDAAWCPEAAGSDSLAYVLFTSGSSGRPKGVMVPHSGIVNRLLWMQEAYPLDASDRVLQKTTVSFDVSVWELFWPLATGARLVMARPGGQRDPYYLADTIAAEEITTLHFVPSMLHAFLEQRGLDRCRSLRRVFASGEALSDALRARFYDRLGALGSLGSDNAELHNLYGPTEASVDVTSWACGRDHRLGFVPIGRPIANLRIHIADRWQHLVPTGLPGELWIAGTGLARGYLGRPDLTAERFVPDPWSALPGGRAYRTGDMARRLPDGVLEFIGRFDQQVKVRGFRIELGEIESVLAEHPRVKEAVVAARAERDGDLRLAAYVVPRDGAALDVAELRSGLRERLPEHMVPAAWMVLPALPLSAAGKVDRKALPAPDRQAGARGGAPFQAPRSPLEALLAGICAEVLAVERVGIHDNFFDLGGNSLLATQVVTTVHELLAVELPLRELFATPTVAQIAALLEQHLGALDDQERRLAASVLAEFELLAGSQLVGEAALEQLAGEPVGSEPAWSEPHFPGG